MTGPGYRLGRATVGLLTQLLAEWRVEGAAAVPASGALIVAANHFSFIDPPLLAASFPRPLTFFAKAELWRALPSRLFCQAMGVLPVRRGEPDRAALRQALAILEDGRAVAVFPEGTRGRTWPQVLKPAKPGIALLALLSGAPVVPVGIAGTEVINSPAELVVQAVRRPGFQVRIGGPVRFEPGGRSRTEMAMATSTVMGEIARLLPEQYRGPYGSAIVRT